MKKEYDVMLVSEKIGSVRVREDGLYTHFSCRCKISGEVMFTLKMRHQGGELELGLLSPMDGCFGIEKRISTKQTGEGRWEFYLRPRHEKMQHTFVPIRAEEPFAYLRRLEGAVMAVRDGQRGIILSNEK